MSKFCHYLNENRNVFLQPDMILSHIKNIKFIIAKNNKIYNFDKDAKGYVLCGKVSGVYKRSKKSIEETSEEKSTR